MSATDPAALVARLRQAPGPLGLLLDYDGTLTPIVSQPARARLAPAIRERLLALAGRPDVRVAIVTGRGLDQLLPLSGPLPGLTLAVNGGLRIVEGTEDWVHPEVSRRLPALARVRQRLKDLVPRFPGVLLEDKELSLALHFRACPESEPTLRIEVRDALASAADAVRLIAGKAVFELQPQVPWDKGMACTRLLDRWQITSKCLFAGDDAIDEPAFEAVQARGGLGVRVGEGESAARWRLSDSRALTELLDAL